VGGSANRFDLRWDTRGETPRGVVALLLSEMVNWLTPDFWLRLSLLRARRRSAFLCAGLTREFSSGSLIVESLRPCPTNPCLIFVRLWTSAFDFKPRLFIMSPSPENAVLELSLGLSLLLALGTPSLAS
jgi:hypothetical protein